MEVALGANLGIRDELYVNVMLYLQQHQHPLMKCTLNATTRAALEIGMASKFTKRELYFEYCNISGLVSSSVPVDSHSTPLQLCE